jgi:hypothetical protein
MAVDFETNCEIGLALPVEPPKAHNLDREGSSRGLPVQKKNLGGVLMRFFRLQGIALVFAFALGFVVATQQPSAYCQETTGGIQGTVKDGSGAVVPRATITVTTPTMVGTKVIESDGSGYYRFSNLPPGTYTIKVEAKGFETLKRDGLVLEVGHLPTVDLTMKVGAVSTVVEVNAEEAPEIDTTTVTTQTNISNEVLKYVPVGRSFQSVIQFAPAASNEPLMGNTTTNGTGSVSPGNGSNGGSFGYSIAGGSDSENSYLVEGQETANIIGGYSHTNVPMDFIDQVEIKSSGVAAEFGGALGGVVNVVMKKGTSQYHGSVFAQFENQGLDAGPSEYTVYDANGSTTNNNWAGSIPGYQGVTDAPYQPYQPVEDHHSNLIPGFEVGGPVLPFFHKLHDRLFFIAGFDPELNRVERKLNYGTASEGGAGLGIVPFSQNTNTYYTYGRVDASITKKIRVFGSWLYQFQKQNGESLPGPDSNYGQLNSYTGCFSASITKLGCTSSGSAPSTYAHTLGYSQPDVTFNTGADVMITQSLVSTTRFGYYFENYHDFGYPTGGVVYWFLTNGVGAKDTNGKALPASFQEPANYVSGALDQLTSYNANKAIQGDEDIAWYKSGWWGTHNFKFGYNINRNSNFMNQAYNEPVVQVYPGAGNAYPNATDPVAAVNCKAIEAADKTTDCQGTLGYADIYDYGTGGKAASYDHSIFAQDSWTIGKGLTFDLGIRLEKELFPGQIQTAGVPVNPIDFSWKDKIAPRIGFAWDVFKNGKMKAFGSYGVFYDQMKMNLAISSFGGAYWNNCAYALDNPSLTAVDPAFDGSHRTCAGTSATSGANFKGGTVPSQTTFIENINFRASIVTCSTCNAYEEAVAPNLKPYTQHDDVAGLDYQITNTVAIEARYDRRRVDHIIEDSAIYDPAIGETFVIVNPGQGVDGTFTGFCQFLYATDDSGCTSANGSYPPNKTIPAARSYDGLELRLMKNMSHNWYGMLSYTYSRFRGNYTGLTSSDISDGGIGGRNSPNNSRAFDEPYFQYTINGTSSSGPLPTDRPNKLKGFAFYELKYHGKYATDFGLFQTVYQGSPNTTYMDSGESYNAFPVQVFGRGVWADITQSPTTGQFTVGIPYTNRNPFYTQSDVQLKQSYKIAESKSVEFSGTFTNALNQHVVTSLNEQIDTPYLGDQSISPGGYTTGDGIAFYAAAMNPSHYSLTDMLNGVNISGGTAYDNGTLNSQGGPITLSSEYGKPHSYQLPRTVRLAINFTF